MSWRARPICMDCQRIIHGPGTGVVGPLLSEADVYGDDTLWRAFTRSPKCALCHSTANPFNQMRLWADEDEPDEGLEFV